MQTVGAPMQNKFPILVFIKDYWPLITGVGFVLLSIGHYQNNLTQLNQAQAEIRTRVSAVETTTQAATVNYATLSGKIDTTNAKLDILLKANNLFAQ